MISDKDISVVVQGPIHTQDNLTKRVLESVRTHLPDAELILSTWKGSDVDGLDCDILLLNEDPGAINSRNNININRQIVSTRNGLQKATRTYAMKLRTDTLLTGTGFIDAFDKYPERREDFKVFQRKVVIPTIYTRNPLRFSPYSPNAYFFHPSDIFQFGLKSDLLMLWSIPNATEANTINLVPEQYIWISCLKLVFSNINFSKLNTIQSLKISEMSLINNFIIDTPSNLGLAYPERLLSSSPSFCYTKTEILNLFKRYIIDKVNSISIGYLFFLLTYMLFDLFSGFHANIGIRKLLMNISKKRRLNQVI